MKKKIFGVLCSIFLGLGCCIYTAPTVLAEEEDTTPPQLLEISKTLNDNQLHLEFTVTDDLSQLNEINLSWYDNKGESMNVYASYHSVLTTLVNDGNNRYHIDVDLNKGYKNGDFKSSQISITDKAGNTRDYNRECADSSENFCADADKLPEGLTYWNDMDMSIHGIVELNAPILTQFQPRKSMQNLTSTSGADLYNSVVDVQTSNLTSQQHLNANFVYYNNTTKKVVENSFVNLNYDEGTYHLYVDDNAKYNGSSYTFLYVYFSTLSDDLMSDSSCYAFMTKDEIMNYTTDVPSKVESLKDITTPGSLDIGINNAIEDMDAPILQSIEWSQSKVQLPAIAEMKVYATDISGVSDITVEAEQNGKPLLMNMRQAFDNTYTMMLSMGRYHEIGDIQVKALIIKDHAGNEVIYCRADLNDEYAAIYGADKIKSLPSLPSLKVEQGQKYDVMLSAASPDLITELKKVDVGKTVVIDTSIQKLIKKEVFEVIKGKDITVIFDDVFDSDYESQGVQWIFNGRDITGPLKDINLKTSVYVDNMKLKGKNGFGFYGGSYHSILEENEDFLKQVKNQPVLAWYYQYLLNFDKNKINLREAFFKEFHKHEYVKITFADNGVLPGKATIRLRLGFALRNQMPDSKVNAYYVNDQKFELVGSDIAVQDDDSYEFAITHNSDYMLTSGDINAILGIRDEIETQSPSTGDSNNLIGLYSFLMASGAIVLYCMYQYHKA